MSTTFVVQSRIKDGEGVWVDGMGFHSPVLASAEAAERHKLIGATHHFRVVKRTITEEVWMTSEEEILQPSSSE